MFVTDRVRTLRFCISLGHATEVPAAFPPPLAPLSAIVQVAPLKALLELG
ncbi:hypothetical protein MXD81_14545 [Microbacteriaceae bacterium K1510]|nr:hypothetical protein [Microbacteriaceae bacterium K1510]